jgi:2-oxoglutarate dehydrogenase E1 component
MKRDFLKPLIIMTPKSLLRAEHATSRAEDFTNGIFEEILPDAGAAAADQIKRVVLCSGKVYYDLLKLRDAQKITEAAIIRIEQLYPFCEEKLSAIVNRFPKDAKLVWCQEESQNMGAWTFIEPRLRALFGREIAYAGRNASASPAVGALTLHKREQAELIWQALLL